MVNFTGISTLTYDEEIAKSLFKELLQLCEDSDFIVRVSASKVLGRLTNPEYFQSYVRQQNRTVYIDTQLVLHALCTGYSKTIKYENVYYKIVDELLLLAREKPNIALKFSKLYLSEVAYQLKLALLLIPFEDLVKTKYSTNIFYQFYDYLKENELLEDTHSSFADFLRYWLAINEDDAYDPEFDKIIISNITDILTNELGIEVVHLPYYETREQAVNVLEKVIKDNLLSPKPHHVLNNDACMVIHLSNKQEHITEPFFLTWDKSFNDYRKSYKDKFHRNELISWHLFNPSKFLNHMSLLEFKIDPKSITNEYLSIIDSLGLHDKAKTLCDNLNRFTDIKNISKIQRRKYVQLTHEIFNPQEFSNEMGTPEQEIKENISKPFEVILDEINKHFHNSEKFIIEQYRKMLLSEDYFIKVVEIIKDSIKHSMVNKNGSKSYLEQIEALIEEFKSTGSDMHKLNV